MPGTRRADLIKFREKGRGAFAFGAVALLAIAGVVVFEAAMHISSLVTARSRILAEDRARLATEVLFSRIGQAIASGGLLCSKARLACWWNNDNRLDNIGPETFGFTNVQVTGSGVTINGSFCLPDGFNSSVCRTVEATGNLRFADVSNLLSQGILTGAMGIGDYDTYGIVAESSIDYQMSTGQPGKIKHTAVIRRPRAFLKIEADPGYCTTSCPVSAGNVPAPPCVQSPQLTGDASQAGVVNVRIVNDGPGYIYAFKVIREFVPTGVFAANAPSVRTFDSVELGFDMLRPGDEYRFSDTLPCYTQRRDVTTMVPYGSGGNRVEVSLTANTEKSGTTTYYFVTNSVDPDNVLTISRAGTTIPAALQTINNINELPPPPAPPAPPIASNTSSSGSSSGNSGSSSDPSSTSDPALAVYYGTDGNGGDGGDGGCDGGGDGDGSN